MSLQISNENNCLNKPEQDFIYSEVRTYAIQKGIKSMRQWFKCHDVHKGGTPTPKKVPSDPAKFFKQSGEWQGWIEFLGTNSQITVHELKSMPSYVQAINDKTITLSQFISGIIGSPTTAFVDGNDVNQTEILLYPKRTMNVQLMRGGQ